MGICDECPHGTSGPNCTPIPDLKKKKKECKHGHLQFGKFGLGTCVCDDAHSGTACNMCDSNYFTCDSKSGKVISKDDYLAKAVDFDCSPLRCHESFCGSLLCCLSPQPSPTTSACRANVCWRRARMSAGVISANASEPRTKE